MLRNIKRKSLILSFSVLKHAEIIEDPSTATLFKKIIKSWSYISKSVKKINTKLKLLFLSVFNGSTNWLFNFLRKFGLKINKDWSITYTALQYIPKLLSTASMKHRRWGAFVQYIHNTYIHTRTYTHAYIIEKVKNTWWNYLRQLHVFVWKR